MKRKFTTKELNILLHLQDGIKSCRNADFKQAEHNFWEIANHLEIKDSEVFSLEHFTIANNLGRKVR